MIRNCLLKTVGCLLISILCLIFAGCGGGSSSSSGGGGGDAIAPGDVTRLHAIHNNNRTALERRRDMKRKSTTPFNDRIVSVKLDYHRSEIRPLQANAKTTRRP
jgi:hypothetical protein